MILLFCFVRYLNIVYWKLFDRIYFDNFIRFDFVSQYNRNIYAISLLIC